MNGLDQYHQVTEADVRHVLTEGRARAVTERDVDVAEVERLVRDRAVRIAALGFRLLMRLFDHQRDGRFVRLHGVGEPARRPQRRLEPSV